MGLKVRVVDSPVPTTVDGAVVMGGFGWYPDVTSAARVYVPSLLGGTRPVSSERALGGRRALYETARHLVEKDRDIFRGLG